MTVDSTFLVRCTRCKGKFRDDARRVRSGYSRQCPCCERMMFFEDGSPNRDIDRALKTAELVRKTVRHQQDEEFARRIAQLQEQESDAVPPASRRQFDRRAGPMSRLD